MTEYRPPVDEIGFFLDHIARLGEISTWPGYEQATPDLVAGLLQEAGRFTAEVIAPLDEIGDRVGAQLDQDGAVSLPPQFREAYQQYVAGGWNAVRAGTEGGGHGFPLTVGAAIHEMLSTSSMAFALCPMLTQSAVKLLESYGSDSLNETYLPRLVSGEWTGTMVLTEPQAGSDLGEIRTRAEPMEDGTWRIRGTKIFITWGEHDLADNIVHFVIARAPDAPPGTRGISLFLVPKYLPDAAGDPATPNDLRCVSIEHKVGIHASPTCVMSFGDGDGAVGYLVGEVHQGMRAMFTMMNDARLIVGMQGLAATEKALQQASAFAAERRQGRGPDGEPAVIAKHPDVQRNLATLTATAAAMRGIIYDTAARIDTSLRHPDAATREQADAMASLLTPVAKAWCSERGVDMASLGIQIHGGMGYVEETGAAQTWRDARIAPIYEGTNGIQAIDLVMRKLPQQGGAATRAYLAEINEVAARAATTAGLEGVATGLREAAATLDAATDWLLADRPPADRLAGATPYLMLFGAVAGARYVTQAAIASAGQPGGGRRAAIASFYVDQLLPESTALEAAVRGGAASLDFAATPGTL